MCSPLRCARYLSLYPWMIIGLQGGCAWHQRLCFSIVSNVLKRILNFRLSIDWGLAFDKPLLTPYEAALALDQVYSLHPRYLAKFPMKGTHISNRWKKSLLSKYYFIIVSIPVYGLRPSQLLILMRMSLSTLWTFTLRKAWDPGHRTMSPLPYPRRMGAVVKLNPVKKTLW